MSFDNENGVDLEVHFNERSAATAAADAQRSVDDATSKQLERDAARRRSALGNLASSGADPTGAAERMQAKVLLAQLKAPADRLAFLKNELADATPGTADHGRAKLAVLGEEDRQAKAEAAATARQQREEGREKAKADREEARYNREMERDRKKADREIATEQRKAEREGKTTEREKKRAGELAGQAELAEARTPEHRLSIYRARRDATVEGTRERAKAELDLAREEARQRAKPPKVPGQQGGSRIDGRALAEGLMGVGGSIVDGALAGATGNTSGGIKATLSGIQAVGQGLMAFGPHAAVAGVAVQALAGAANKTVGVLDGLVDNLGKYSAATTRAQAELDIIEEASRIRFAKEAEPLMTEWLEVKKGLASSDGLLAKFERSAAGAGADFLKNVRTSDGSLGDNFSKRVLGPVRGVGSFFSRLFSSDDDTPRKSDSDLFKEVNASMLDDLRGGKAAPGSVAAASGRGAFIGVGPGSGASVPPPYMAPGNHEPLGFSLTQHNAFSIRDEQAVDQMLAAVKDQIVNGIVSHNCRAGVTAGLIQSQIAVSLAL